MPEERRFEKLHGGFWVTTEFKNLKKGDTFRIFDGEIPVKDGDGRDQWIADSDAYVHDDGTRKRWRIDRESDNGN